jgi:hypothetical protein
MTHFAKKSEALSTSPVVRTASIGLLLAILIFNPCLGQQTDTASARLTRINLLNESSLVFNGVQQQQQQQQQQFSTKEELHNASEIRQQALNDAKHEYRRRLGSIPTGLGIIETRKIRDGYNQQYADAIAKINTDYLSTLETIDDATSISVVRMFPGKNSYLTMLYYNSLNRIDFFRNTNLNYGNSSLGFKNEVAAGYLGIFRADVSTALTRNSTKTLGNDEVAKLSGVQLNKAIYTIDSINISNSAVNKIITGGGEIMLNLKIPVVSFFNGRYSNSPFKLTNEFISNASLDAPTIEKSIPVNKATYFGFLGFETNIRIDFDNFTNTGVRSPSISLFAKIMNKYTNGSSSFRNSIGVSKGFVVNEFYGGIAVKNFVVYYTTQSFSIDRIEKQERFGVMFIQSIR